MAFDETTIAAIVRNRLGEVDASRSNRIIWAIPQAIDKLARKVAANPRKRPLLLTTRADASFALVGGRVELADLGLFNGILIEYLQNGAVWFVDSSGARAFPAIDYPVKHVANKSEAAMIAKNHLFRADYLFYWLDGTYLNLCPRVEGVTLTGKLEFVVPYRPTLFQFLDLPELQDDLIEKVIEIVLGPGNDAAEDDEK